MFPKPEHKPTRCYVVSEQQLQAGTDPTVLGLMQDLQQAPVDTRFLMVVTPDLVGGVTTGFPISGQYTVGYIPSALKITRSPYADAHLQTLRRILQRPLFMHIGRLVLAPAQYIVTGPMDVNERSDQVHRIVQVAGEGATLYEALLAQRESQKEVENMPSPSWMRSGMPFGFGAHAPFSHMAAIEELLRMLEGLDEPGGDMTGWPFTDDDPYRPM